MIPRFGKTPEKGRRYTLRPGAYALLPRDGVLLLTCQMQPEPDLQLPGGGIDPGESPLQALHREVLEETGWRIANPRYQGAFRRFVFMPEYDMWAEKMCHIFSALPVIQIAQTTEAAHETVWMRPDLAVHELGNAGDRFYAARLANRG